MANSLFDISVLNLMVEGKYVNVQKHPTAELYIYNYGPKVQYERVWNDVTVQCRGLILDKDMNVVARPFRKFFNLSEHDPSEIPSAGFEVFEKMDGSMGILYWHEDKPYLATRGSFDSVQARKGTEILHARYTSSFDRLDRSKTYIFEIIYPENRIVCDYGDREDLVLLAVMDNETGEDHDLADIGFPIVKRYDGMTDMGEILAEKDAEREGYVIRFRNGFRVKVKFEEYCRLHKILTQVSNKTIWDYMSTGKDFDELLDRVPDEFYGWVRNTRAKLQMDFDRIFIEAQEHYRPFDSRKEAAEHFLKHRLSSILFSMLDEKDPSHIIWRMVKPKFEKPFASSGEE